MRTWIDEGSDLPAAWKGRLKKDMDLHGLHVLLTEDNDLNAEIAICVQFRSYHELMGTYCGYFVNFILIQ